MTLRFLKMVLLLIVVLAGTAQGREQVVASVGATLITERDISCRVRIEEAYGSRDLTQSAGVVLLINESIEAEVARRAGMGVSAGEVQSFSEHVNSTGKAPEILDRVKKIFQHDLGSYERLYLMPRIINTKLRYWYSRNREIHRPEQLLIEKAYGLAASGASLKDAAALTGLDFQVQEIEDRTNQPAPELAKYTDGPDDKNPLIAILDQLKAGALYDHIVENDQDFLVIRLIGRNGNKYSVEAITARKKPFDAWFMDEAAGVKIGIIDQKLKKAIRRNYPGLWWVKQL